MDRLLLMDAEQFQVRVRVRAAMPAVSPPDASLQKLLGATLTQQPGGTRSITGQQLVQEGPAIVLLMRRLG
jgi:hypothetical protein